MKEVKWMEGAGTGKVMKGTDKEGEGRWVTMKGRKREKEAIFTHIHSSKGKSGCVKSRDVETACCEIFPQPSQQFLSAH